MHTLAREITEELSVPVVHFLKKVRRHFHNDGRSQCYSTWFRLWGGWASAAHCVEGCGGSWPEFTEGGGADPILRPLGLDVALAFADVPTERPDDPVDGQEVTVLGFPAGARHMEMRRGVVYMRRHHGQIITRIDEPAEPVVVGMSGGPVLDTRTGRPIGILILRNSPAQLDKDPEHDESCDFVPLSAVWDAVNGQMPGMAAV